MTTFIEELNRYRDAVASRAANLGRAGVDGYALAQVEDSAKETVVRKAAAPDLLEALEAIRDIKTGVDFDVDDMNDLIAKQARCFEQAQDVARTAIQKAFDAADGD